MTKKNLVHIVWLVVAVVAFVGGMYYGKSTVQPSATGRGGNSVSSTRGGFGGRGGGFVAGQVVSKDAQSITIQLPNGNSQVVFYSSSTMVIKPSPASVNDLAPGTNVMIGGAPNSDGSLTAQSIQIRSGNASGFGGGRNGSGTMPASQ